MMIVIYYFKVAICVTKTVNIIQLPNFDGKPSFVLNFESCKGLNNINVILI